MRQDAARSIQEAATSGARVAQACETSGVSAKTLRRWLKTPWEDDQRKGPKNPPANKLSESERLKVIELANSEKYRDLSPDKIVPALADEGRYVASVSTFYRILRKEKLLAHRSNAKPAVRHRPEPLVATKPNQVYSWDITYLKSPVKGMFFYLYMVLDVYSRAIVGWRIRTSELSEHAAELMESVCREQHIAPDQVRLHSDNGSPMKGATMLATLRNLGVVASFSRPSVSNDNPYSESLFRTIKYCPEYPSSHFESTTQAEAWVRRFEHWYNHEHLHSGIKFVTPASRHRGDDAEILIKRKLVYQLAKSKNPNRWSGDIRNWDIITAVHLNPAKNQEESELKIAA